MVGEAPRHNLKEARSEGYKYASQLSSPTLFLKEQRTQPLTLTLSLKQTQYSLTFTNSLSQTKSPIFVLKRRVLIETGRSDFKLQPLALRLRLRGSFLEFFFLFPFLNFTVLHLGFVGFLDSWMIFMGFLVFFFGKRVCEIQSRYVNLWVSFFFVELGQYRNFLLRGYKLFLFFIFWGFNSLLFGLLFKHCLVFVVVIFRV